MYCDFYFVTTQKDHRPFVDALQNELRITGETYAAEPIETLYFGGGTPSVLSLGEVTDIIDAARTHFDLGEVQEVTFELNPEDASPAYLAGLHEAGITRLSIGIQSFFEEDLRFMGRSHSTKEAFSVIPQARAAGFNNFSIDLIFGVPDQPAEHWERNLEHALSEEVPHLSTYSLTIEPKTPLAKQVERGLTTPAPEDEMADRYRATIERLEEAGYEHYEISSFARPGTRAQHNQIYWTHDNYLGLGPSAHSFWKTGQVAERWSNVRSLRKYVSQLEKDALPVDDREQLSATSLADEYLMLRLRTSDGLDLEHFRLHYGRDLMAEKPGELQQLETEAYIHPINNGTLRLTNRGMHVCDSITALLST